jgi:hypothetical protein
MARPGVTTRRLLAVVAIVALLLATTAYLSHIDNPAVHASGHASHCELCLQWGGAAGAPAAPVMVFASRLIAWAPLALRSAESPPPRRARSHRSRAPPLHS